MKISDNGLKLIKSFEGCHLKAYKCPAGVWTIGYGHTKGVYDGMTITQSKADDFLREDCSKAESNVNSFNSKYNWTQNEFDALVSFAYNIGSINQLTANGTRTKEVIANKILAYNKAGGKVLNGLVKRRKAEQEMFLKSSSSSASTGTNTLRFGSKGEEVRKIQNYLNSIGYSVGTADGVFGNNTKNAVIVFQKDSSLTPDGVVGVKTREALNKIKSFSLNVDGDKKLSTNFKVKEFKCKDGTDHIIIDVDFVNNRLQKIRDHYGVPVTINSAYRTRTYNKKVGGATNSYHIKGRAFDIIVKGHTPSEIATYARSIGINGVIEYNTFVHIDSRPKRYWARNNNGKITTVK